MTAQPNTQERRFTGARKFIFLGHTNAKRKRNDHIPANGVFLDRRIGCHNWRRDRRNSKLAMLRF